MKVPIARVENSLGILEINFLFGYTIDEFTKADMKSEENMLLFLYAYIGGGK